jgi:CxxC-x17-CxxC domain-containing protein
MEFQDRVLRCVDCGSDFVWTVGEQAFFADKQFKNEPKRCRACKALRGPRQVASTPQPHERVETRASCSSCGKETTVPFRPTQGRPVYCRECFQHRKPHGPRTGG